MKKILSISFVFVAMFLNSCTNGQNKSGKTNLSAVEFAAKIKEIPTAPVVDVDHLKNIHPDTYKDQKHQLEWR